MNKEAKIFAAIVVVLAAWGAADILFFVRDLVVGRG